MNNIFDIIEKVSDEAQMDNKPQTRIDAINSLSSITKSIAMAAVPFAVFMLANPKKASAASKDAINDALNFALTLEYLESSYYTQGINSGVISSSDRVIFSTIVGHEDAHVSYLQTAISQNNGTPVTSPTFDFTASGQFSPFTDYPTFLALAQAFEDTGVRAYKGQAATLMSNDAILTAALKIHSVEARHAAEIRKLRTAKGLDTTKPWITGNNRGTLPSQAQPVYNGEDNTTQGGVTLTAAAATEAFDEPLDMASVNAIASLFIH
jgi:rubrerythrin